MPGLYKVLKPTRTGVVLESLDEVKKRIMAQTRHKISILKEVSIFTTGAESSVSLEKVFQTIYEKYQKNLTIDHKTSSEADLRSFLLEIVPNYDTDRVYVSDMKKLVSWYKIAAQYLEPIKEEAADKEETKAADKTAKKDSKPAQAKPSAKATPKKQAAGGARKEPAKAGTCTKK